jgi:hypothetical protein
MATNCDHTLYLIDQSVHCGSVAVTRAEVDDPRHHWIEHRCAEHAHTAESEEMMRAVDIEVIIAVADEVE